MLEFGGRPIDELELEYAIDVDRQTGAANMRIPIRAPLGRGGLSPALGLAYSSSAGNSVFGWGWSLEGFSTIGIDTREHLPRWDGSDSYELGGAELVRWLESTSATAWRPRGIVDRDWSVAFLRLRTGGARIRVEQWVQRSTGRVHFRTRDAHNVVTVFGARADGWSRIADPGDPSRVFRWLPELQIDPTGNAMWFEYTPEDASERDHAAPAQRYLKRIRYGNAAPIAIDDALLDGRLPERTRFCFQLVFDYGDHGDRPSVSPDRSWPSRGDPFSSYRSGFELRTQRLCARILAFHDFDELGPDPTLVGELGLVHDADVAGSMVTEVRYTGHRKDGSSAALPPLRMTYAAPANDAAFVAAPAETNENIPAGLAGNHYLLVDLLGDGLPGIVTESERSWFYKENRGGGQFGAQTLVLERPATQPGAFAFGDVDRDGDVDLAQLAGRMAGLFEHDRQAQRWRPFRPIAAMPHVEAFGGRAEWVDLNGDGRLDIVVARNDRLVWFASEGDAFAAPIEVPLPTGARSAPTFAEDPRLDLFFADMTGDGLVDLVRVESGRVEYWPSLGNGRFGDGIVLDGAPRFAREAELDPSRLRFVDLDGSGTSDLVYLGHGEVAIWFNASGNQLVAGPRLGGLPYLDNVSSVQIVDFLGDGRPCLVWSSPLPGRESLSYLALGPPTPPRTLVAVDDALGREIRPAYASSATHYLRDAAGGRPWITHLPSHVQVVDRREVIDHVGGTRSVQRFEYHDGFFDGGEREFRGFGQVDVYDAEAADGDDPGPGEAAFAPPALVRTWFHLGTPMWNHERPIDWYAGDRELPLLPPHALEDVDLTPVEVDDALRVLAGLELRRERYAVDAQGRPGEHPLDVVQTSYRVRRVQPTTRGGRGAFVAQPIESLTAVYEQIAGDPRLTQHITVETDAFDQVVREAEIGYPRRSGRPRDVDAQGRLVAVIRDHGVVHLDEVTRFELGIASEQRTYELLGLDAPRITRDDLRVPAVIAALATPYHHHVEPPPGLAARLLGWDQSFYWDDAQAAALPHRGVGAIALVHHVEAACFAPDLIASVFAAHADDARLISLGYVQHDGLWWQAGYTQRVGTAAQFFVAVGLESFEGGRTTLDYDRYALALVGHTDAVGNHAGAILDYHVVAPVVITDPNGNVSEVRYDPLGVVVAASGRGNVGANAWGFAPLADRARAMPAALAEIYADPERFLDGAARAIYYDLHAWQRDRAPPTVVTLAREQLPSDGWGGGSAHSPIQVSVDYVDGLGQTLQTKTRIEPGPAIQRGADGAVVVDAGGRPVLAPTADRWRVSGHVVLDGKRQPAREYQPYFSPSPAYEGDEVLREFGVSTLVRYDAIGREVGRDLPNGTLTRVTYGAWSTERADENDTVLTSPYRALRQGRALDDPERQAFEHARAHAGTTGSAFVDPLGREVGALERGGTTDDRRHEARLDAAGHVVELIDPRVLAAFVYQRDMLGRVLRVVSRDAGASWSLPDTRDRVVYRWDARGLEIEQRYDLADRPTTTQVRGLGLDQRVEERMYGEGEPDAAARNLRGRASIVRDQAGESRVDRYTPAGQVMSSSQRLRIDVAGEPDWRSAVALDPETFTTETEHDALGRPRRIRSPDGVARSFEYLQGGDLARLTVSTRDGRVTDTPVIAGTDHDPRGAPTLTRLGNGVDVTYHYDAETFRFAGQTARRGTRTYQDLRYTHDPVGNLVRIEDGAHDGPGAIIRGTTIAARRDFVYDAHYRLRRATGRVHQALLEHDDIPGAAGTVKGTRHLSLDNGAALEPYARTYDYDPSGNLRSIGQVGTSRSWTTRMWISPTSNRSAPLDDPNGIAIADPEAQFDAVGNVVALAHLRRLDWSWRGCLARAVVIARPGGTDDDEVYVYGADRMRVRKIATRVVQDGQIETTEKLYLGDCERKRIRRGDTILLERWTSHFDDGNGCVALLHRWTVDTLGRETDAPARPQFRYQLRTHQGSSAIELDDNGALLSYEEYFPYGGTAFLAGDRALDLEAKEYRYTGKERDDVTGLDYYGHRYLASWIGRWLSPDPIGPEDDLNLYQFVLGDPVGRIDEDGLQTLGLNRAQTQALLEPGPARPTVPSNDSCASQRCHPLANPTQAPPLPPSMVEALDNSVRAAPIAEPATDASDAATPQLPDAGAPLPVPASASRPRRKEPPPASAADADPSSGDATPALPLVLRDGYDLPSDSPITGPAPSQPIEVPAGIHEGSGESEIDGSSQAGASPAEPALQFEVPDREPGSWGAVAYSVNLIGALSEYGTTRIQTWAERPASTLIGSGARRVAGIMGVVAIHLIPGVSHAAALRGIGIAYDETSVKLGLAGVMAQRAKEIEPSNPQKAAELRRRSLSLLTQSKSEIDEASLGLGMAFVQGAAKLLKGTGAKALKGRPPWWPRDPVGPTGKLMPSGLTSVPGRSFQVRFQGPIGPVRDVRGVHSLAHLDHDELMKMVHRGTAPLDALGNKITLHHFKQWQVGPPQTVRHADRTVTTSRATASEHYHELSATTHAPHAATTSLHPYPRGPSVIDRIEHNAFRVHYWQARALRELEMRTWLRTHWAY